MTNSVNIENRWFAIVNPVAGKGKGLSDWPVISTLLHEAGIAVDALFTQRKFHATELAVYAVNQGYRKIIAIGGDGTIHEIVNGLFIQTRVATQNVLLSVITVGTGNDWIRMFGIPKTYAESVNAIRTEHTFLQDIGRVTYWESQVQQTKYLSNVAGVAYDAAVCQRFNRLKDNGYRGKWLYIWGALYEGMFYRSRKVEIVIGNKTVFNKKLFNCTIGICKYTSCGLSQTPYAIADDGLFDITIIPDMNRLRLFSRFRALYTDNIYNITGVSLQRANSITIRTKDKPINLEIDGEFMGYSEFNFDIIPKAIKAIVSQKFING